MTTATRADVLPDLLVMSDFIPGFEASAWVGLAAPMGTASAIIDTLNKEVNAGLADPAIMAAITRLGGTVLTLSPAAFGKFIAEEVEKWAKVIRAAKIKIQ